MAKVYDVPADELISKLSEVLKTEDIPAPSWILFVKTGAHEINHLKNLIGGIPDVLQYYEKSIFMDLFL